MRILIANPFGIGDVLFSLPLVHALREIDPGNYIGYLCNRRTEELVAACLPIDWHLVFEKDEFRAGWKRSWSAGFKQILSMIRAVSRQHFDLFIDLSMGWHYGLGTWAGGIPRRVGFDFRGRGRFLTDRLAFEGFHNQPVSRTILELLPLLEIPLPKQLRHSLALPNSIEQQAEDALRSHGISNGERWVAIVPGGGASWGPNAVYKQWPPERFLETANHLISRFGARILLVGDAQEENLCRRIAGGLKTPPLPIQSPSLLFLAGLLKRCDLVVGNDSGPMHLAASVGTKTVTIFGPVDADVYGPLSDGAESRVVARGLACRPCYRGFRFPPCPWDNACLKQLAPSQVIAAAEELLA